MELKVEQNKEKQEEDYTIAHAQQSQIIPCNARIFGTAGIGRRQTEMTITNWLDRFYVCFVFSGWTSIELLVAF